MESGRVLRWRDCSVMAITSSGKSKQNQNDSPLRRHRKLRKKKVSAGFMLISQVLKEDMFVVKKLSDGDDFKKVKSWSSKLISQVSRWWSDSVTANMVVQDWRLQDWSSTKVSRLKEEQWSNEVLFMFWVVRFVEANVRRMSQRLELGFWLRREKGWELLTQGYAIRKSQAGAQFKSQRHSWSWFVIFKELKAGLEHKRAYWFCRRR